MCVYYSKNSPCSFAALRAFGGPAALNIHMLIRELLTEAAYDSMVDAMRRQFPEQDQVIRDHVRWAKQALKKPDRVTWYLRLLRADLEGDVPSQLLGQYQWRGIQKLGADIVHFFGFNYAPIEQYQFQRQSVGDVILDLTEFEQEWHSKQEKTRGVTPQEGDYKLFEFGNGTAWWWVNRAYCPEEGRSGGHCGNVTGQYKKDQRILSLRNAQNQVLLTFILEPDGTLGEMKAKNNQKPSPKYHPQIMKLLMWERITGIAPPEGQYAPDKNFNIFDLDPANIEHIDATKPQLIKDQITGQPFSLLNCESDDIKRKYASLAPDHVQNILLDPSDENWQDAIDQDPKTIIYAPETLPNFEKQLLAMFRNYGSTLEDWDGNPDGAAYVLSTCPSRISGNPQLVAKIVSVNPLALPGVNPNIRNYAEVCMVAVKQNGEMLYHVPQKLKSTEMCEAAVQQDGSALRYVPETLRTPEMCMSAVTDWASSLYYVPDKFKTEKMCMIAVEKIGSTLKHVPRELRTPKLCMTAVKQEGLALQYVPRELQTPELCVAAIRQNSLAFQHVPYELKTEKMIMMVLQENGQALVYVPDDLKTEKICMTAINNDGRALQYVPRELQTPEMCETAVKQTPWAFQHVPDELKTEKMSMEAVKFYSGLIQVVPDNLKARVKEKLGL